MTTPRDITIYQGQAFELSLDYAGTAGRGQRMHIRLADSTATVIQILTHNGDANARVIFDTDALDITIGASVSAGWVVLADRVEWVYDIEDYDLADEDNCVIPYRGKVIVRGNRTRSSDVTPSEQMPSGDGRYVRFDGVQGLSAGQQLQARENIGAGTGGGSSAWGGITGTLTDQTDLNTALGLKAPLASPTFTGTPAAPTAAGATSTTQIATTAFVAGEITTHAGAADPHGDRSFATSAVSTHAALTTGAHGITAAGAALLDDADAAAQRTTLGLGTAATTAATAYEASGAIATHNAVTTAHGISAYGATLVDDADASTARTTLGLGTAATSASGDFATAGHNHSGVYQPADAELTAIAGLTSAADSAPYFTGSGTAALMTVTAAGRALIDDADATAQRATLGLVIGTNVQAYDADLTTWAGITPGTGVATALGTNVGTAGAPVINGGALGTPSSATLTNATGLPPAGITQSGATSSQVLAWNGSAWAPATPSASPGGSDTQSQYNNAGSFAGLPLWRVDANTLWQYNGTTAQTFLLSGTRTDASDYEALSLSYTSGAFEIAPIIAGTGTRRPLRLGRRNDSTYGYIEVIPAGYGATISAFYGNESAAGITFSNSFSCSANKDTNISGKVSVGRNGLHFDGRAGYNIDISFRGNWGYDQAVASLNLIGCAQYSANTTNLLGGNVTITGGAGASASAGLAHGGSVNLDGGQGYGTGKHGNVIIGATRGKLQLTPVTVANLGSASPAGQRTFATDANATTFHSVVAGGGSNFVPVFSDGTDWRIG